MPYLTPYNHFGYFLFLFKNSTSVSKKTSLWTVLFFRFFGKVQTRQNKIKKNSKLFYIKSLCVQTGSKVRKTKINVHLSRISLKMSVTKIQLIFLPKKRFDLFVQRFICDKFLFLTVTFNNILRFALNESEFLLTCAFWSSDHMKLIQQHRSAVYLMRMLPLRRLVTNNPEKKTPIRRSKRRRK